MSKGPKFVATARAAGPGSPLASLDLLLSDARWLTDPRHARGVRYRFGDVLSTIVVGVLCNCDNAEAIEQWARNHAEWLHRHIPGLAPRIPSQDTILRVLALIRPEAFAAVLTSWTREFFGEAALDGQHIALDGKAKRGTAKHNSSESSVHAIAAMLTGARIVLAETPVDSKQNEISAAPDLLRALELRGALVSGDAMYAQTALAEQIVEAGGDYFLQIKGNQPTLQQEMTEYFLKALDRPNPLMNEQPLPTIEVDIGEADKAHGRIEQRITVVAPMDGKRIASAGRWKSLAALVLIFRWRVDVKTSRVSHEAAMYITSRRMDAKTAGATAQAHWGIEAFHYVLDVTYGEDACTIADVNAAHNLGLVRRLAQGLLGQVEPKRSNAWKRRECAMNANLRERTLGIRGA